MLCKLLADAVARHGVKAQTAVLRGHVQAEQAHFAPFFVQLHGEFTLFVVFLHDRVELTLGKFADHFDDVLLLGRHAEIVTVFAHFFAPLDGRSYTLLIIDYILTRNTGRNNVIRTDIFSRCPETDCA